MSEQPKQTFGEQLIRSQSFSHSAAERYRSEMQALLEERLTPARRWGFGGVAAYLIVVGLLAGFVVGRGDPPYVAQLRWLGLLAAGVCLIMGVWFLCAAVRGRYNRKTHRHGGLLIALLACGFGSLLLLDMAWTFDDPIARRRLIFAGVTLLLILGGTALVALIEDMHRRTEERLIRLEYRLAELSEKIDRPQQGPDK